MREAKAKIPGKKDATTKAETMEEYYLQAYCPWFVQLVLLYDRGLTLTRMVWDLAPQSLIKKTPHKLGQYDRPNSSSEVPNSQMTLASLKLSFPFTHIITLQTHTTVNFLCSTTFQHFTHKSIHPLGNFPPIFPSSNCHLQVCYSQLITVLLS